MSDDTQGFMAWVIGGVATIIATLAGTVATLWRAQVNQYKDRLEAQENASRALVTDIESLRAKADECLEERGELRERCANLEMRVRRLEEPK